MPFLLIVFLTLACLPDLAKKDLPIWGDIPRPAWIPDTQLSVLLTGAAVFFMVAWAWRLSRQVGHALATDPAGRDRALHRYETARWRHYIGLFVMYVVALCVFGWGWAVADFWSVAGSGPTVASAERPAWILPGAELLVLAPFLGAMILSWVCFYDADRAAYLTAHKLTALDPLARALLDPDMPLSPAPVDTSPILGGRWSYVLFKVRHNLVLVFIPLTLLLVQKELFRRCGELLNTWGFVVSVLGFVVVLGVLALMPWVIRVVLGLKPLPDGPLRCKLVDAARRMKFRHSDILVWNTHGTLANAMMLGILPWPRYVVFTDRLLEEFTPDEVLAVFGHEMGHTMHHHMLYYLTFIFSSMFVLTLLLSALFASAGPDSQAQPKTEQPAATVAPSFFDLQNHPYLRAAPMMGLMLGYIFVVFGFISRRCERQADVYGCRTVSCGQVDCLGHHGLEPAGRPVRLCPTGIGVFIQALDKVALLNGINREKPGFLQSWQHSTIAKRVTFLKRLAGDPALEPRFQRRVFLVKCGMFLVLELVVATLMWTGKFEDLIVNLWM